MSLDGLLVTARPSILSRELFFVYYCLENDKDSATCRDVIGSIDPFPNSMELLQKTLGVRPVKYQYPSYVHEDVTSLPSRPSFRIRRLSYLRTRNHKDLFQRTDALPVHTEANYTGRTTRTRPWGRLAIDQRSPPV